jgi:hypothetical protein
MNRVVAAIALAVSVGTVMLGGCSAKAPAEIPNVRPANFQPQASGARRTPVTKEAFDALKTGMPEAATYKIMGSEGVVQSDNGTVKITLWRDGTKMIGVTFRNGRLAGKTQYGL